MSARVSRLIGIEGAQNLVDGAALFDHVEGGFDGGIEEDDQAKNEEGDGGGGAIAGEDGRHADNEGNKTESTALKAVVLDASDDSQDAADKNDNADDQINDTHRPEHLLRVSTLLRLGFFYFFHASDDWEHGSGGRHH